MHVHYRQIPPVRLKGPRTLPTDNLRRSLIMMLGKTLIVCKKVHVLAALDLMRRESAMVRFIVSWEG